MKDGKRIKKRWAFLLLALFWAAVLFENHVFDPSSGIIRLSDGLQTGAVAPGLFAFLMIVWTVLVVFSFLLVAFVKGCGARELLILGILTGLVTIVLVPFAMPIDEVTHFFRAYSISSGHLLQTKTASGLVGDYVPEKLYYVMNKPANSMNLRSLFLDMKEWGQRVGGADNAFYENGYAGYYLPIGYLPAAVGLAFARLIKLPLFLIIYAGRLTNFLFYLAVCFAAFRKAPYFRNVFFLTALNPGAVYLACTYSTDGILICQVLLFVSICLRYYFAEDTARWMRQEGRKDSEIDRKTKIGAEDMTLLVASSVFIASMKTFTYSPILLLFFLIPSKSMSLRKRSAVLLICMALLGLMGVGQAVLLREFTYNDTRLASSTDTMGQIAYVMQHPVITGRLVLNFLDQNIYCLTGSVKTLQDGAGVEGVARICAVLPIFTAFLTKDRPDGERRHMGLVAFALILYVIEVLALILSLYIISTDVGGKEIIGMQSRYMLPLLPILYLLMAHLPIGGRMGDYDGFIGYMSVFALFAMLVTNVVAWA
ncbi:MAG: DUF2142 domain-containing protein [Lachnospiraceae bacterium]|nr:DUF2142 domain-containing protein [Lachnospiraceae bacterium]